MVACEVKDVAGRNRGLSKYARMPHRRVSVPPRPPRLSAPARLAAAARMAEVDVGLWLVIPPHGASVTVRSLAAFCRPRALDRAHLSATSYGRRRTHKGYVARRLDPPRESVRRIPDSPA